MAPIAPPTDGPPPNPVTSPAAAQEAGAAPSAITALLGGAGGATQGPDLSGIMMLGQKLEQGLISLAQAVPLIAPDLDQCKAMLLNALGKFASSTVGGTGTSPTAPMQTMPGQPQPQAGGGAPTGMSVSQAGPQFPGAQGGGRPF